MSRSVSSIATRIALRLDIAVAFEALIVNRLEQLPAGRREEWLRGLLVRGFQNECRSIKALDGKRLPAAAAAPSLITTPRLSSAAAAAEAQIVPSASEASVSLAGLQQVIG